MSYNPWNYTSGNPVNATDPTGRQGCTVGGICPPPPNPTAPQPQPTPPAVLDCYSTGFSEWTCDAQANVRRLKTVLVQSASRHNRPGSNLDNNALAALAASLIVGERRVGNPNSVGEAMLKWGEDRAAGAGCLVSGHLLVDALQSGDWKTLLELVSNELTGSSQVPAQLPTVVIGNVWLTTAMNLQHGKVCSSSGQCIAVDVQVNAPFPVAYPPPDYRHIWQDLEQQLLDEEINVEYLMTNLEAGIVRAKRLKANQRYTDLGGPFDGPSVFNLVAWHASGVQTDKEIAEVGWDPGHGLRVVDIMPLALRVLGLQGQYNPGVQYKTWKK